MLAALCKHTVPGGLPTLTIWIQSSWIVRTALGQMAFLFADKACREWELRCVGQGEGAVVKLIRSQLQLQKKVAGDLGELFTFSRESCLSAGRRCVLSRSTLKAYIGVHFVGTMLQLQGEKIKQNNMGEEAHIRSAGQHHQ